MSPGTDGTAAPGRWRSLGRRPTARDPGRLILPLSGAAWLLLLLQPAAGGPGLCQGLDAGALGSLSGRLAAAWQTGALAHLLLGWTVMTAAMMLPLTTAMVRHVAGRSFEARRGRAAGAFVAGYLGLWTVVGLACVPLVAAAPAGGLAPAAAFLVAAAWQLTRWKAFAFRACHRTLPLSPWSWRADRDCLRFGAWHATACAANCWPIMLACMLAPQAPLPMACAQAVLIAERRARLPSALRSAIALVACAVLVG